MEYDFDAQLAFGEEHRSALRGHIFDELLRQRRGDPTAGVWQTFPVSVTITPAALEHYDGPAKVREEALRTLTGDIARAALFGEGTVWYVKNNIHEGLMRGWLHRYGVCPDNIRNIRLVFLPGTGVDITVQMDEDEGLEYTAEVTCRLQAKEDEILNKEDE